MGEEILEVTPTLTPTPTPIPTPSIADEMLPKILEAIENTSNKVNDFYILSTQNQEVIYNKMIQTNNYLYFIYGMLAVCGIGLVFYLVYRLFRLFF